MSTLMRLGRNVSALALLLVSACGLNKRQSADSAQLQETAPLNHAIVRIDGQAESLAAYRGKVLLVVNTASECGFTKQYAGLEELYRRYRDRGLVVMGFPCNDFMGQEPGSNEEIAQFCQSSFGVDFPMFQKLTVQGDSIHPLYKALTSEGPQNLRGPIKWNFTKFLVDTEGRVRARFEPRVDPLDAELLAAVEPLLPR
jgi:glutathione peroxidase